MLLNSSCVDCHKDQRWLVKNKKLYDYYQDWNLSVHQQEGTECHDCHGGYPDKKKKEDAHGTSGNLGPNNPKSAINFQNVPETCNKCHSDVFEAYIKSKHYKELKEHGQGPNCVTCHGSLNNEVLTAKTVGEVCAQCHNEASKLSPEVPAKAESILHKYLASRRFYHWIVKRGQPHETKQFFQTLEARMESSVKDWHPLTLMPLRSMCKL